VTPLRIGDLADLVRSKNAGPFWQTLDVFLPDDESYRMVAESPSVTEESVAGLYQVDPDTVLIFRLPDIRVLKISFPRRSVQGGVSDRDMHAGQQHVPLAGLLLEAPSTTRKTGLNQSATDAGAETV
jgi:hypothetical protein